MRIIVLVLQAGIIPKEYNLVRYAFLNDDTIAAGMGFGTHPHDNMEITIPLEGDLAPTKTAWEIQKSYEMGQVIERNRVKHRIQSNDDQELNCCRFGFSKPTKYRARYQQISLNPEEERKTTTNSLPNAEDEKFDSPRLVSFR
jgi:hypothetical protein